jgi:hypothetical protein
VIPTIQFPKKLCLCSCVLDTVADKSLMVFEDVLNWIHSRRLLWPHSDLNKKPSNTHCLPSCPLIDVAHSVMNWMTATVCYMGQHVGWCDWLVTQNSMYWHHIIGNISCLNSHFLSQIILKWSVYQHICHSAFVCYWCLLITSGFENLGLPLDTEQPCWRFWTDSEVEIFLGS